MRRNWASSSQKSCVAADEYELGDIYIPRQFKALRHTMSRQNSYRRDVGKDPEKIVVIAM
jgi:hypothetical protein